jgi:hypothetical protein
MNAPDTDLGVVASGGMPAPLRFAGAARPSRADGKSATTTSTAGSGETALAADWLCLAAAPTFAAMALLTLMLGDGMPDMVCGAAASPLLGMAPMYVLMSAFHTAPWLRLVAGRRNGAGRRPGAPTS